jgi:hypothetical protein
MVQTFGITDVQFYDWFVDYQTPTSGDKWTDPWSHSRQTCLTTIHWYLDELHHKGARAWAYVQSIASEDPNLADSQIGIYELADADGNRVSMSGHPLYFANAAWADHQVSVWAQAIADLGFDGVHWDTLGPKAGDYGAEAAGFHAFLEEAAQRLSSFGLQQTMNFVEVSWWDDSLLDLLAFPYAEVWSMTKEQQLYATMDSPGMQGRWGVMPFYPSVDAPSGWTQSQVMLARWNEAPKHHLRYLIIGDGEQRLVREYFPDNLPLTPDEVTALQSSSGSN